MDVKITVKKPKNSKVIPDKQLYRDIKNSVESDPRLRKEIRRVFQMANRRIQNIESAGVFSPAVASLNKGDIQGYSKFSISRFGNGVGSWSQIKKEYGRAVQFLMETTSTAQGARAWNETERAKMGVDKATYNTLSDEALGKLSSTSFADEFNRKFLYYKGYVDEFREALESAKQDVAQRIEQGGKAHADALQTSIDTQSWAVAKTLSETGNAMIDSIFDGMPEV